MADASAAQRRFLSSRNFRFETWSQLRLTTHVVTRMVISRMIVAAKAQRTGSFANVSSARVAVSFVVFMLNAPSVWWSRLLLRGPEIGSERPRHMGGAGDQVTIS